MDFKSEDVEPGKEHTEIGFVPSSRIFLYFPARTSPGSQSNLCKLTCPYKIYFTLLLAQKVSLSSKVKRKHK
jgi:hypothetical protein